MVGEQTGFGGAVRSRGEVGGGQEVEVWGIGMGGMGGIWGCWGMEGTGGCWGVWGDMG